MFDDLFTDLENQLRLFETTTFLPISALEENFSQLQDVGSLEMVDGSLVELAADRFALLREEEMAKLIFDETAL
ncbi:MAG: hypothetical protein QOE96_213 [Blastocatellia bacterium]|jgi:hypothetical protein|nr:hypothetical protein [Blastocatellia bacterium]